MKKHVWIMNHYATNMFYDQGGRHHWFAKYLRANGYNPTIFCANTIHNSEKVVEFDGLYTTDESENIKYIFVKTTKTVSNGIDRIKNMVSFYLNLKKVAKELIKAQGKPDVILASSVHPLTLVAGIQIGKKYDIPVICEVRDLWPESIVAYSNLNKNNIVIKALYSLEKWVYKYANSLIFTMEGGKQYIIDKGWDIKNGGRISLNKVYYINNGVDLEGFNNNSLSYQLEEINNTDKGKFIVTYTGSIRKVNKIEIIVDAAELITDSDIVIYIYGDGDCRSNLEDSVRYRGINNIIFKGKVDKKYIPHILSKSNLNIISGESLDIFKYGLSANKNFDYLASGKPILTTFSTNYSLVSNYNVGIELSNPKPQDISDAIMTFKNMEKQERDELYKNINQAVKEFDFKNLTSKLIDVIEGVSR